jgi:hypothetical protein
VPLPSDCGPFGAAARRFSSGGSVEGSVSCFSIICLSAGRLSKAVPSGCMLGAAFDCPADPCEALPFCEK